MLLPVTLTIAAAAAFINLWLALRVSQVRYREQAMDADAGASPLLVQRMRAHANFAENAPVVLILMALIELAGGAHAGLWLAGVLFVAARLAHPLGMERPAPNPWRAGGAMATWVVLVALAAWALVMAAEAVPAPHRGPVIDVAVPPRA